MDDLSLIGLRTVCEVARRGSFSAAAAALGYTQSAVSRQVALVEQAVGRTLFERHARGAQLTVAGELVTRHATSALAELQAARLALEDLDGRRQPRVRLAAFSTAMATLVPDALGALAREEPGARVVLNEGISERLTDRLSAGRLDLALITVRAQPPEGLVLDVLLEDPLLIALPRTHPLVGRGPIDPELLYDQSWIVGSSEPGTTMLGAWTAGHRRPRVAYEVRDWTAKIGLVASGLGVTMVPGCSALTLPASVAVATIDHPAASRTVGLLTRAGTREPHVAAVIDALQASAQRLSSEVRRASRGSQQA